MAGILDPYGGLRFVVTHKRLLKHHARPYEVLITVPGTVHEPIAWNDIPGVVFRVETEVRKWLDRGVPNNPDAREAAVMYKLRCMEQGQQALDLHSIAET